MLAYLLSKTAYLLSSNPRIMRARDSSNNRKIEITVVGTLLPVENLFSAIHTDNPPALAFLDFLDLVGKILLCVEVGIAEKHLG